MENVHEVACTVESLIRDHVDVGATWVAVGEDFDVAGVVQRAQVTTGIAFGAEQVRELPLDVRCQYRAVPYQKLQDVSCKLRVDQAIGCFSVVSGESFVLCGCDAVGRGHGLLCKEKHSDEKERYRYHSIRKRCSAMNIACGFDDFPAF